MDVAEVGHLRHAAHVGGARLRDGREDRRHGAVDPDVDRPERALDLLGRLLDGVRVGDVERTGQPAGAHRLDLAQRLREALGLAGDQAQRGAAPREGAHGGAADPSRGARDDDDRHRASRSASGSADRMPAVVTRHHEHKARCLTTWSVASLSA